jgi:hypothetical protein
MVHRKGRKRRGRALPGLVSAAGAGRQLFWMTMFGNFAA